MSQSPSGKGMLSFNFLRKGVSLSLSLHSVFHLPLLRPPYTALCRKNPYCRVSTTKPEQVLLSGQPTSPDTMHTRENLPAEAVLLKCQRAIRNAWAAVALVDSGTCSPKELLAGTTLLIRTPHLELKDLWYSDWENMNS